MNKERKMGWKPDLPDYRDFAYKNVKKLKVVMLPDRTDLRESKDLSPVEDQSIIGSCTANAIVGALEYLTNKTDKPFKDLSRLFVYYNERELEDTVNEDSGAMLRDGIKTLGQYGVCSENLWTYDVSKFAVKPSEQCYEEAKQFILLNYTYHRLNTLYDMRSCLAEGYPFVFGFTVYDNFLSEEVAKTGILNMPTPDESCCNGHAVCCCGFCDQTRRFLVRNSWGSSWGQQGYFTIPYEYLSNRDLSDDFWTIRIN